jgi:hypothetical protein
MRTSSTEKEEPMPQTMALILRSVPVFARPDTESSRIGKAKKRRRYPFVKEQCDAKDGNTYWYQIKLDGKQGWIVESSYSHDYADLVDGDEGEGVVQPDSEPPSIRGELLSWDGFTKLLPMFAQARYHLSKAQYPILPLGMERSLKRFQGDDRINCSMTSCALVTNAMDTAINGTQYGWWQVYKGTKPETNYGPGAAVDMGVGVLVPEPARILPTGGVYLIQHFPKRRRGGHSYLVIDCDDGTGRILTLEATKGWRVNGLGFRGLGSYRDVGNPGADWAKKQKTHSCYTWQGLCSDYKVVAARLRIDHASVKAWLAGR